MKKILVPFILAFSLLFLTPSSEAARPCHSKKGCATTTTTSTSTSTSTTSTTSSTTTTTSPSVAPDTQGTWVSPEGVTIKVNTTSDWTIRKIYDILLLESRELGQGMSLTVSLQDFTASQTTTSMIITNGQVVSFNASITLKAINSTFSQNPNGTTAHEYGHAWTLLKKAKNNGWDEYLTFRGLLGDPRLNTSYNWDVAEIAADDYRLLFGSTAARSYNHLNSYITPPLQVAGLTQFMIEW